MRQILPNGRIHGQVDIGRESFHYDFGRLTCVETRAHDGYYRTEFRENIMLVRRRNYQKLHIEGADYAATIGIGGELTSVEVKGPDSEIVKYSVSRPIALAEIISMDDISTKPKCDWPAALDTLEFACQQLAPLRIALANAEPPVYKISINCDLDMELMPGVLNRTERLEVDGVVYTSVEAAMVAAIL